jgi:hypothetical protein
MPKIQTPEPGNFVGSVPLTKNPVWLRDARNVYESHVKNVPQRHRAVRNCGGRDPEESMKIYLSSTYTDLHEYRAAVDLSLRSMGHDIIGMEQYVAENTTPLDRCLRDVRSADLYLIVIGWSYGYVPTSQDENPDRCSITELELKAAEEGDTPVLAFLLDTEAPWPPSLSDAFKTQGSTNILRLREQVGRKHLAGIFDSPDSLASRAAVAVSRHGIRKKMAERVLRQATLTGALSPFAGGAPMDDSATHEIRGIIIRAGAGATRALEIRLGTHPTQGEAWWSTRLYLLALLAQTLTGVRQFVFSHDDGTFAGMASPETVREGLAAAFPQIADFDATVRSGKASKDTLRETQRCMDLWNDHMKPEEEEVKVGVRPQLLAEWLGEGFIGRCMRLGPDDEVTVVQVQQIVESLVRDIPLESRTRRSSDPGSNGHPGAGEQSEDAEEIKLKVVDRDAFALELAREWVRMEMPRLQSR